MKKYLLALSPIILIAQIVYSNPTIKDSQVMTLSVSSDGSYAVTTNMNRHAYLWDLKHKTVKDLGSPYNIYSAYFVPNTNYYMLQKDDDNEVVINDVAGKQIKAFQPNFATYGEAIDSSLTKWAGSDVDFNLFLYRTDTNAMKQIKMSWCMGDHGGKQYQGSLPSNCSGFGNGSLMGLEFSPNNQFLVGSDMGRLFIYDLDKMTAKWYQKNSGQTMNAISPDGKYVYTADQQFRGVKYTFSDSSLQKFFIRAPNTGDSTNQVTNFRFIDDSHALMTYARSPYPLMETGLYDMNSIISYHNPRIDTQWAYYELKPSTYLPLVKDPDTFTKGVYGNYPLPYPTTGGFNMTFDTSPSAHILVTGQANGDGIMVYQYHADKQSLELIWSPSIGG